MYKSFKLKIIKHRWDEELNKWRNISLHGLGNPVSVMITVTPKLSNRFNKIPAKYFGVFFFFVEIENLIQNLSWNAHYQKLWRQFSVKVKNKVKLKDLY